jgi:divalent metal cation (Fe/Co/Zn/Cd) transporter
MRIHPLLIVSIILIAWGLAALWQAGSNILSPFIGGSTILGLGVGIVLLAVGLWLYRGRSSGCHR